MALEDIGFYTLSDERARTASIESPMIRCEMLVTDRCNFKCPYCRGMRKEIRGDIDYGFAAQTVIDWAQAGLMAVRFSGGEPTLYNKLHMLCRVAKLSGIPLVAVSSNGSASKAMYDNLMRFGVNDFSISLDACCASTAEKMAGKSVSFDTICDNIRYVSSRVYTSVGVVLNAENLASLKEIVTFASSLGVADIRIIPAAQYANALANIDLPADLLAKHPILKFRTEMSKGGCRVRGLDESDPGRCGLVLDDSIVAGKYHFPCIIYMREGGDPIGEHKAGWRSARKRWHDNHDPRKDPICSKNCLDFCLMHNKEYDRTH